MLIDRYIARAQLQAFLIVFVSLAGLTFVVDAFTNIEEFIAHAPEAGGLARVLGAYYGYRLISFFDATSPVISLASAIRASMMRSRGEAGVWSCRSALVRLAMAVFLLETGSPSATK